MWKIGTLADWFAVGVREGIKKSEECGAVGVQLYAWNEMDPLKIKSSELKEIKTLCHNHHQEVAALCAELGGHGLETAGAKELSYLKKTIEMATQLDCKVVTTHFGVIPEDEESDIYKRMLSSARTASKFASQYGVTLAVETGPEPIARLVHFIESCGNNIGVNYDPANLVMVTEDNEVEGVYTAASHIVHTHAKDGKHFKHIDCKKAYGIFADGGIDALNNLSNYFEETELGKGDVRWKEYLKALKDTHYDGFLTIEHETRVNAEKEIKDAVLFLQNIIPTIK